MTKFRSTHKNDYFYVCYCHNLALNLVNVSKLNIIVDFFDHTNLNALKTLKK